jgi:hypothetical protein
MVFWAGSTVRGNLLTEHLRGGAWETDFFPTFDFHVVLQNDSDYLAALDLISGAWKISLNAEHAKKVSDMLWGAKTR